MNKTFEQVKREVLRLLGDEPVTPSVSGESLGGNTYNADLLKDGVHAALDAITTRCWKSSKATLLPDADYGLTDTFDLPTDLIDIEGVRDLHGGTFLPKQMLQPGDLTIQSDNAWIDYPSGKVTFVNDLDDEGAEVYYSASWTKPEDDLENLEPPLIAATAICFFAASYCLLNAATAAANIRQFATKVDSGQPTDNPLSDMSNFFLRRYEIELQRIPAKTKGQVM